MRRTSKKAWGRSSGFCHWTERICARQWAYLAWTEMTGKRRPKPVRCAVIRLCAGAEYTLHLAGGDITFDCAASSAREVASASHRLHFASPLLDHDGAQRAPVEQEVCNDVGHSDPSVS